MIDRFILVNDVVHMNEIIDLTQIQVVELLNNYELDINNKNRKIDELEKKLADYDKRWKERYLVNNPFEDYYRDSVATGLRNFLSSLEEKEVRGD